MAIRKTAEFRSDEGRFYKIELYDSDFSGTPDTWDVDGEGFLLKYETKTEDRFTGLIPSSVKFTCIITTAAEQTIVDDIRTADAERFQVKISTKATSGDGYVQYWVGNVLNDVNDTQDAAFPRKSTLTAIDGLANLKDLPLNEGITNTVNILYSFRNVIQNILKATGTSLYWGTGTGPDDRMLFTLVDWDSSNMPTRAADKDPLTFSAIYPINAYRTLNDNGTETYQDCWSVLNDICKVWGARLFLAEGSWYFIQVNHYAKMLTAAQFFRVYNRSGTLISSGSNSFRKVAEGNFNRLAGGGFDNLALLKKVEASYNHIVSYNTLTTPIVLWNNWWNGVFGPGGFGVANSPASPEQINLGEVTALTGSSISVRHIWRARYLGSVTAWNNIIGNNEMAGVFLYYRLKLVGSSTTYYANHTDSTWSTSAVFAGLNMGYPQTIGTTADGFGYYNALMEFETDEVPEDGTLFIEAFAEVYYNATSVYTTVGATELPASSGTADIQSIINGVHIFAPPPGDILSFSPTGSAEFNASEEQYVKYLIDGEQTTKKVFKTENKPGGTIVNSNAEYDAGELMLGSGPTAQSWGRIRTSPDGSTFNNGTDNDWQSYGTGTTGEITKILVEEIMVGQQEGARVYNGNIRMSGTNLISFKNSLSIDSNDFTPYQVTFNATKGEIRGQFININYGATTNLVAEAADESLSTGGFDLLSQDIW